MKNRIGIFLLVCLNGSAIFLNIFIAMFSFGIIVNGSFSLELSAQVVKEILTWFSFFGILSGIINYFILKYLNQVTKPLLLGLLISLTCFLVSFPFVYIERDKFLENGRGNAIEIDVNLVQDIFVKNLNTGKNTFFTKRRTRNNLGNRTTVKLSGQY